MQKIRLLLALGLLLAFATIETTANNSEIKPGPVLITGKIEQYKGIYKTGKLTWFDAVTRTVNDEIFEIDDSGAFSVKFELVHPIIGSFKLDLENNFYSNFLIEPGNSYSITIQDQKIVFNGESGIINQQLAKFNDSINLALGSKIKESDILHNNGLAIEEYLTKMKQLEIERLAFLTAYKKHVPMSDQAIKALESEIRYKTAHAWINYRFNYSTTGRRVLRDSLPVSFYENLLNDYPINSYEAIQTRNCIDYISNLAKVFEEKGVSLDRRIAFYKSSGFFSDKEIEMIQQLYNGNTEVAKSEEFKRFKTPENMDRLNALSFRYQVNNLLDNVTTLIPNLGRDLIISQSIAKNYFENNLSPSSIEWEKINRLISDKSIYNYLRTCALNQTSGEVDEKPEMTISNTNIEQTKKKYIDKYIGKVIYIDFYATWCGPCREEIPYAQSLSNEFKDKEVVFLNLCCQSKKEDWENMIKQKGIEGENYFLDNKEYNFLSKLYKVNGFPTYILIDKKGNVNSYSAPRPSSKMEIIKKIKELLK